jgi:hypothetical protein
MDVSSYLNGINKEELIKKELKWKSYLIKLRN